MYFMSAMQHFFTILIRHRALRRGMMAFASEVAHLTSRRTFHNVQKYFQNAHDAEISSLFAQPDLAAGCAFAPQALAKTPTAVTASQPEIASGSAMIVDLATKKSFMPASLIWCARWRRSPK